MDWYLETDRIRLRAINNSDGERLWELNGDPEVMRYLDQAQATYEATQKTLPLIVSVNQEYQNKLGIFAAFLRESQEYIGWFILRPDRESPKDLQNLEIGFRLKRIAWGKGYGTEVSTALLQKAQRDFRARRVYATAMRDNRASRHIMEKIGLKFVKYFTNTKYQGKPDDDVLYEFTF